MCQFPELGVAAPPVRRAAALNFVRMSPDATREDPISQPRLDWSPASRRTQMVLRRPRLLARLLRRRTCEACRLRPARKHDPFCSQECAETFVYYDQ